LAERFVDFSFPNGSGLLLWEDRPQRARYRAPGNFAAMSFRTTLPYPTYTAFLSSPGRSTFFGNIPSRGEHLQMMPSVSPSSCLPDYPAGLCENSAARSRAVPSGPPTYQLSAGILSPCNVQSTESFAPSRFHQPAAQSDPVPGSPRPFGLQLPSLLLSGGSGLVIFIPRPPRSPLESHSRQPPHQLWKVVPHHPAGYTSFFPRLLRSPASPFVSWELVFVCAPPPGQFVVCARLARLRRAKPLLKSLIRVSCLLLRIYTSNLLLTFRSLRRALFVRSLEGTISSQDILTYTSFQAVAGILSKFVCDPAGLF